MPVAAFTMNPAKYAGVNENITFNGSASYDPDTNDYIKSWVWDFGDSYYEAGMTTSHQYSKPGNYTIRLTVRDNADPFGEDWVEKIITVAYGAEEDNDMDGLRDYWEWEHFGSLNEDGMGDPDLDGATNKEEHDAGTDPKDSESKPISGEKGDGKKSSDMDLTLIIIVVVIVVVVLFVFIFVLRSKKAKEEEKEQDEEAIAAMEEKIKRAKKLGLPTRELEKVLEDVKDGKPLAVELEPVTKKKGEEKGPGKGHRKGKGQQKGKGKRRSSGKSSSKGRI